MGPEEANDGDDRHQDLMLDEWLSRDGPEYRRDDLYDGDW